MTPNQIQTLQIIAGIVFTGALLVSALSIGSAIADFYAWYKRGGH